MEFSLLYFSGDGTTTAKNKYELLLETAKFADSNGFSGVWIPERHFHAFGGLYPNPAVISSALAMVTNQVKLRSGSVVLPLQNPIRVAEEWAVVDNLSQGRVELSFASGWHANDFVLAPEKYGDRKEILLQDIDKVKRLWKGESLVFLGGINQPVSVKTFPQPLQSELTVWMTAKAEETFIAAGKIGSNILTALMYETTEDLAYKISLYRKTLKEYGHNPHQHKVALLLHTFIDADMDFVKETVKKPFCNYLSTHFDLVQQLAKVVDFQINPDDITEADKQSLLEFAFERYFDYRVMIGTPEMCRDTIQHMEKIGVDEIACMIDFGVDLPLVMSSLKELGKLKGTLKTPALTSGYSSLSFFG
ncbi:MAG: LLM class flavin-dependent oxidoreductase [Chroococcales cyanobacterium]